MCGAISAAKARFHNMRAQGIRCDMKERKRSEKAPLKVRRFRRVSNVLIVCTLVALVAVTMGVGGAGGVLAMNREDVYYSGRTDTSSVAVMINVYWGEEYLPQILQTLQDAGAKATFFIGGSWADDHNGELMSIVRAGHEVGSHGYFHKDGDKLDLQGNLREVRSANALLQAITGEKPQLFAPPSGAYGEDTLQACRQEGMKVIMWSKDTIDWRDKDEELVYARATDGVKAGDLILMHPTAHTANALPRILRAYERAGLKAVTVSELVDIKI